MYTIPPSGTKPVPSFLQDFTKKNQSYSVGNRIYNGSSPSPHAGGGLDPTGYQERDSIANTTRMNLFKQLARGN